ncbi:MAG: glycoside hydrolase family 97 catalytic domain-containing protein [bacterium]|nr:glycoside hydrolase family 97 catalytic domain-containing protein [bacterium]
MKKKIALGLMFLLQVSLAEAGRTEVSEILSPDGKIAVHVRLAEGGIPVYTVSRAGETVLRPSRLGVLRLDGDFTAGLTVDSVSAAAPVSDRYTLTHGKRRNCAYSANRRVFHLKNAEGKPMQVIFQVSNDGVAFRYHFPGKAEGRVRILREASSFHFDGSARAYLQHCPDARTGWNYSQPSYEEYYQRDIPVGTASPDQAGWVMPALFRSGKHWISLTETAVDTNYCGTRLSQLSPDGEYTVQFPQPQECRGNEPALPQSSLPWSTPWRVIAVSEGLAGLVESTLGTDLAIPARTDAAAWLKPGLASWSWVILKDDSTVFGCQRRFVDFAADMKWRYCLVDAFWDSKIGYEKMKELADYAATRNVKLLLWYNSAGDWNTTPLTPRDKMLTAESRRAEFQKLRDMGVAGVKIDFFGGDGQSMMKYYQSILLDAAKYGLAVNFHGSTYPRGWVRTYPNLVSMEGIKGEEYVTFGQFFADQQPVHCTMLPFTRNLFDPMDFTPVNFSGIPNVKRRTTGGFEAASAVLFTSGIQHIAETPEGMAGQKEFVREYMRSLPEAWDDVKFIDGVPGEYVVLARKTGNRWFIAGINGENRERTVSFRFPAAGVSRKAKLITDSADSGEMIEKTISLKAPVELTLRPHGGFVIRTF